MTLATVDIFHAQAADSALDALDGTPPAGSILAAGWNAPLKMNPATVAAVLSPFLPGGVGAGGTDAALRTFNLSPLLVAPDAGPGSVDDYDPWTLAGTTPGANSMVVINSSANGFTILGLVSTGRRGDILIIEVGGDGHGFLTLGHMASATGQHKIYCPDGCDVQIPKGGTVVLQCLNDTDHGWRLVALGTGTRNNGGPPLSVTLPSGNTNNWNPTGAGRARRWRITTNVAGSVLTGIAASPDGLINYNPGEIITLENFGDGANTLASTLTLKAYNSGSSTGNRFLTPGLVDVVIPIYGTVQIMLDVNSFDGFDWLVLAK